MPRSDAAPQSSSIAWILLQIASLWLVADIGYFLLLPAAGFVTLYSASPFAIAAYYSFWIFVALITFAHLYRDYELFEDRRYTYGLVAAALAAIVAFAAYFMPLLPAVEWTAVWQPPELRVATSWYFLPKSIEIFFQQLLIMAFVLAFRIHGYSVKATALWCALLFGGAHLLLFFGGLPIGYVVRFLVAASIFGFCVPYLLLRFRYGFIASYGLHWFYYALSILLAHYIPAYVT